MLNVAWKRSFGSQNVGPTPGVTDDCADLARNRPNLEERGVSGAHAEVCYSRLHSDAGQSRCMVLAPYRRRFDAFPEPDVLGRLQCDQALRRRRLRPGEVLRLRSRLLDRDGTTRAALRNRMT